MARALRLELWNQELGWLLTAAERWSPNSGTRRLYGTLSLMTNNAENAELKQMLSVAKNLREKSVLFARAGRDELAEAYAKKAEKIEYTVKGVLALRKRGL